MRSIACGYALVGIITVGTLGLGCTPQEARFASGAPDADVLIPTVHDAATVSDAGTVLDAATLDAALPDAAPVDLVDPDAAVEVAIPDAAPVDVTAPDADLPSACPDGMLYIPTTAVCIDRYEASEGTGGIPQSVVGLMPWSHIGWDGANTACQAAGKRLCEQDEWQAACEGPPPGTIFPYGDGYEPDTCNVNDTGILTNVPTGSMTQCEGGYPGLFDMSGNVREWINDCQDSDCKTGGGSYTNQGAFQDHFLKCANFHRPLATVEVQFIGFRCCVDPM